MPAAEGVPQERKCLSTFVTAPSPCTDQQRESMLNIEELLKPAELYNKGQHDSQCVDSQVTHTPDSLL